MSLARGKRLVFVWVLLAVLVALIGYVHFKDSEGESNGDGHGHVSEKGSRDLLPISVAEVGAIEIAVEGQLHRFERDDSGSWFYHGAHATNAPGHAHQTDPALAERMSKSFAALDKARMEREFPFDKDNDRYGVVVPKIIVMIYKPKETQPLAQYAVGDLAPDATVRYIHLVGTSRVITLPQYHIDNLLGVVRAASASVSLTLPGAAPAPAK